MHLGNIYTAYISWKSVREQGGRWILRIEDLDPGRSRKEYARQIEDDLAWLGLDWDEGGMEGRGENGPYCQSLRGEIYEKYFRQLAETGLVYGCTCRRADILATQAPHQSDGRVVYAGTCRPKRLNFPNEQICADKEDFAGKAARVYVPDSDVSFTDRIQGAQRFNLARECGDFVVRRSDGAWAYQLAVVVDDALMGVTEVVRGSDLLLSAAQQTYLYRLLGFKTPEYAHVPLICNSKGERLSKRDRGADMEALRKRFSPSSLRAYLDDLETEGESIIVPDL